MAQSFYTCVDAKGRNITSDRPIAECMDRPQKEFTPQGTLRRVVPPPMTVYERAAMESKEKAAAEAKAQAAEEKRRNRALLQRYPNKELHNKERAQALALADEASKTAVKRIQELTEQRKLINVELEFYKNDPNRAPLPLRRRLEDNEANMALQKRFVTDQENEKQRINARFDEELARLIPLWISVGMPVSSSSTAESTVLKTSTTTKN